MEANELNKREQTWPTTDQHIIESTSQPANHPVSQPTNQPTNQPNQTSPTIRQSVDQLYGAFIWGK